MDRRTLSDIVRPVNARVLSIGGEEPLSVWMITGLATGGSALLMLLLLHCDGNRFGIGGQSSLDGVKSLSGGLIILSDGCRLNLGMWRSLNF